MFEYDEEHSDLIDTLRNGTETATDHRFLLHLAEWFHKYHKNEPITYRLKDIAKKISDTHRL